MQGHNNNIVEERVEVMVTRRPAHFLKPCQTSAEDPSFDLPVTAFRSDHGDLQNLLEKVKFAGWKNSVCTSQEKDQLLPVWKIWVDFMKTKHESTWRNAGIYDAIIASTYSIKKDPNLILGIAERWCEVSNTFVFPWGEAMISLEDALLLGGFSVTGKSALSSLEAEAKEEFKSIDKKFKDIRKVIYKNDLKSRKITQSKWIDYFMRPEGSDVEHEAFLVLWLSQYVFPRTKDAVVKDFHEMAFQLARGTRLALAPTVLARLYNDLKLLKKKIVVYSEQGVIEEKVIELWSLMQLVQVWAWERFPTLSPEPNLTEDGEPRMACWNKVRGQRKNLRSVRLAVDSAADNFVWRPYINSRTFQLYPYCDMWVPVHPGMPKDYEAFAKLIRVSMLVGFDYVEEYFPNRASSQFGMDQDIPGKVAPLDGTPLMAWEYYDRPIGTCQLYIPSRLHIPSVTKRYSEWWKEAKVAWENSVKVNDTRPLLPDTSLNLDKAKASIEEIPSPRNKRVKLEADQGTSSLQTQIPIHPPGFEPRMLQYPPGFEPRIP